MEESIPILERDVERICGDLCKIEVVYPLVRVFRSEADPSTFRHRFGESSYTNYPNYKDSEIYAKLKTIDLSHIAMAIRQRREGAILDFYRNGSEDILKYGESDSVFCRKIANISAMPRETGIWARSKGYQMVNTISVHVSDDIILPSKEGKWFFDLMSWFALICSDHPFPDQRERFWRGNTEKF